MACSREMSSLDLVGVLFVGDVGTELPHKAGVIHEAAPPLEHRLFDFYSVGNVANPSRVGTAASLYLLILIRTIRLYQRDPLMLPLFQHVGEFDDKGLESLRILLSGNLCR
jgi:hypothetical protein